MANIWNWKINERSNVERPNLQVTTIENENWEDNDEQFQDLLFFGISIVLQIGKILEMG